MVNGEWKMEKEKGRRERGIRGEGGGKWRIE
jgi:hypothetical protein